MGYKKCAYQSERGRLAIVAKHFHLSTSCRELFCSNIAEAEIWTRTLTVYQRCVWWCILE